MIRLALAGALSAGLGGPVGAQDPATEGATYYAVAQPGGPATASGLRMRHPLYLLDLCRQVKAGTRDRGSVERLVGRKALDALLGRDLEALWQKLTDATDVAGTPPSPFTLWHRILTDDLASPPPGPDVPSALDFHDVGTGDFPIRILRVTSPADGPIEASLPAGSPFRILSLRAYDGSIVQLSPLPRRARPGAEAEVAPAARIIRRDSRLTYRAPEIARPAAPWLLPVRAGQDVEVLVGLPVDAAVPPGLISSTLTVGDPVQGAWRADVPILAQTAFKGAIKIRIDTPQPFIDFVQDPVIYPKSLYVVNVPLSLSSANPPVTVKGRIQAQSLPQGLSMPVVDFTLAPQQTLNLAVPMSIVPYSPAWNLDEIPQAFSLKVSYQTTAAPLASRTEIADFYFTIYPSLQSWRATFSGAGVQCTQDLYVYSTGWTVRSGDCDNRNAYTAKITAKGTLASITVMQAYYPLGWFDQKFWSGPSGVIPFFRDNYVLIRGQPLFVEWAKN